MDRSFELNGKQFQLSKIDAFKQFHIVRKIAPILGDLIPAMKDMHKVMNVESLSESEKFDQFAQIAAPLMNGISRLSDVDADRVLYGLLSSVEMKQEAGNYARVASGDMLMIQNLDLSILLQLAGRAFIFNLQDFFAALPRQS
jgi:hypothetical protein